MIHVRPLGARIASATPQNLVPFYETVGFALIEARPERIRMADAGGAEVWLETAREVPGAVLVWPGEVRVFYDLEGNLHRSASQPTPTDIRGRARLHAVLYGVVDLVESGAWYEAHLGLAQRFYDEASDWLELGPDGGVGVALTFLASDERRGVLLLIAPDVRDEVERLQKAGFPPIWTRRTAWGRLAAWADPEGNPLVIIDRSGSG